MSAIPSAVRRQAQESARLQQQFISGQAAPPAPEVTPSPPPPQPAPATPPVSQTTPAPSPPSPPAPVVTPPAPQPDNWEARYRTLDGKYRAEVPRLRAQVQELTQELETVKQLLGQRVTQPNQPAPTPAAPAPQPARLVTDEEVREYGPDLIDMFRRVAREELQPVTGEIDRRIAPVQQRIDRVAGSVQDTQQRVKKSQRQLFFDALAEAVPNWQAQNDDPLFAEWLDQRDPYSGKARGELLTEAYEALDAPRVVAFFNGYLREHAMVTLPATPQPAPEPAPAAPGTQVTLESLVAPGTPKAGAPRTPDGSNEKRIWTRDEIKAFYELRRRKGGLKQFTAEQIAAMDADIIAAGREGRIR